MADNVKEKRGIFWCKEYNVPLISPECSKCNSEPVYCSSDLRPVFENERMMLSRKLNLKIPSNVFYNKGRLIYNGKTLLYFSAKDGQLFVRKKNPQRHNLKSSDKNIKNILKANEICLRHLEEEAIHFIQRIFNENKAAIEAITVSFSGGKDSMVVADLVKRALPREKLSFFFVDTTLELPDTYLFIKKIKESYGLQIKIISPVVDFFEMMRYLGPPSRIMRWCCSLMKSNPVNKMLQESKGMVLNFDGIRGAESATRNKYARFVDNPKIYKQLTARPIFNWSTFAVWLYIFKYNLPINPAYFNGFNRVGCGMCPSNSPYDSVILSEFYTNKDKSEKEWQMWNTRWQKFRKEIIQFANINGKKDPEEYFDNGYWKARKPNKKRS